LEYTDAKESLLQAARKAPVAAQGFRIQCNKWAIIVRLLLGEIPERTIFVQKGMEKALRPYFELTNVSLHFQLYLFIFRFRVKLNFLFYNRFDYNVVSIASSYFDIVPFVICFLVLSAAVIVFYNS
jgi:hypothetical protein